MNRVINLQDPEHIFYAPNDYNINHHRYPTYFQKLSLKIRLTKAEIRYCEHRIKDPNIPYESKEFYYKIRLHRAKVSLIAFKAQLSYLSAA